MSFSCIAANCATAGFLAQMATGAVKLPSYVKTRLSCRQVTNVTTFQDDLHRFGLTCLAVALFLDDVRVFRAGFSP